MVDGAGRRRRRQFLAGTVGAASVATAGCSGGIVGQAGDEEFANVTFMQWDGAFGRITERVLTERFEDEFGVTVNQIDLPSPQEMVSQIQAEAHDFHLVSHWNYSLYRGVMADLFQPLRVENVPRLSAVEDEFHPETVSYDPGEQIHHVPYSMGGYGLAYNTDAVEEPGSWDDLLRSQLSGAISNPGWLSGAVGIAAKHVGTDLANVEAHMDAVWDQIRTYDEFAYDWWGTAEEMQNLLADETVLAGGYWFGRAHVLREQGVPIQWTVPEEGTTAWIETYSIPRDVDGKQRRTAEAFINFVLEERQLLDFGAELAYAVPYEIDSIPSDHIYADHPVRDLIGTDRIQVWDSSVLAANREAWTAQFQEIVG